MKTKNAINEILDEAMQKAGFTADNQLALAIGVTRQAVSRYRKGLCTPNEYSKSRLADLTGRNLKEITSRIEAENEPDEIKRKYWENLAKSIGGIAASLLMTVTLNMTPSPAEAAPMANVQGSVCILC